MASDLRTFQYEALSSHNKRRDDHGVPPMRLDLNLCRESQRWAEQLARTGTLQHSNTKDYGENLSMSYNSGTTEYTGTQVSDYWYSDMEKFDFQSMDVKKGPGYFSQMVWKGSEAMGIGKAITKNGEVIVVGQYKPAGNVKGQFQDNVFPVRSGVTVSMGAMNTPTWSGRSGSSLMTTPTGSGKSGSSYSNDDKRKTGHLRFGEADTSPKDLKYFRKDLFKAQNEIREKHGAAKLTESPDLMDRAQKFAAYLAEKDVFQNSSEDDVGENIAMHYSSASTEFSGHQCADMWYKQVEKYNFGRPEFTKGAGHFTQMVWRDSKEFGAGKAVTREGKVILVGFYKPPGNVVGGFEENVRPANK